MPPPHTDPPPLVKHRGRSLGVLVDIRCRRVGGRWMGESPFIRFLQAFRAHFEQVAIFGRPLDGDYPVRYPVEADGVRFVPMPPYRRIPDLLTHPWRWWGAVDRVLARELPAFDTLWLNVGHPVSIRALQRIGGRGATRCFGVMRGAYTRDARRHERGWRAPLAGAAMQGCQRLFAHLAARHGVPCLTYGPEERAWLRARGVPSALVYDTVLTAGDLSGRSAEPAPPVDILTVGRLDPVKGFEVLIEALSTLRGVSGAPATLRIVGSGPERGRLEARVGRLGLGGRVSFAGHVAHGPALFGQYLSASVYAQPSHTEGTPKTVLEALGFGLPVVATRVGAMAHLVEGETRSGLLVPPGDVGALRGALETMLGDEGLRRRCGEAARRAWGGATMQRAVSDLLREAATLGGWGDPPAAPGAA